MYQYRHTFSLPCNVPDLPFAFAPRDADTAWAYAKCGHVVHQYTWLMLGNICLQNECMQRFDFWSRTMGHLSNVCWWCWLRARYPEGVNPIVCAMCGALIMINSPVCVRGYRDDGASNPYWQYATRVSGHESRVVTCQLANCASAYPIFNGRWNGFGLDARRNVIYLAPINAPDQSNS